MGRLSYDRLSWVLIWSCYLLFIRWTGYHNLISVSNRFDGFTSTFQDKLFKGYDMEIHNQIFYTTFCSCVLSLTGKILTIAIITCLVVAVLIMLLCKHFWLFCSYSNIVWIISLLVMFGSVLSNDVLPGYLISGGRRYIGMLWCKHLIASSDLCAYISLLWEFI